MKLEENVMSAFDDTYGKESRGVLQVEYHVEHDYRSIGLKILF